MRMLDREDAFSLWDRRKDLHMRYRLPHRPPYRRSAGPGLANLVAAFLLGLIIYRKGVEDGKKTAEHKPNE